MSYSVQILADSIANNVRLVTLAATYPRIIHSEMMTHRNFSRNAASSRAVPVEKSIERVLADPFVPEAFAKNVKGMQGGEELANDEQAAARGLWTGAMIDATVNARALAKLGVHKHWANRLLEPWSWITTVITATEWENFFALRCHPAAAPEFQKIAGMIRLAMAESQPEKLAVGGWHLPFVQESEMYLPDAHLVKLSVARCARVSYLTHDGKRDVETDLALYEKLLTNGHLSPFEHAACALFEHNGEPLGNFRWPWMQHRKLIPNESNFGKMVMP